MQNSKLAQKREEREEQFSYVAGADGKGKI